MNPAPAYRCAYHRPHLIRGVERVITCNALVQGLALYCEAHARADESAYEYGAATRHLAATMARLFAQHTGAP